MPHQGSAIIPRERLLVWMTSAVFIAGMLFGGGPTSPGPSMIVELIAVFLAAVAIAGLVNGDVARESRFALALLAIICLVPLAQLVPLPADRWSALPGHEVPAQVARLVGFGDLARPLTLAPEQTRLAALTLIVPAAIFLATLQIGPGARDQVLKVIVATAFGSAVLGIFQVAAGGGIYLHIYRQVHDGYAIGLFANRNHEGDLMLIALPASALLIRSMSLSRDAKRYTVIAATLFFSAAVIATQSRTAASLLPLALAGTVTVWVGDLRDRRIWLGLGALIAALIVAYGLMRLTPAGQTLWARFSSVGDDLRPTIWQNTRAAVGGFWPMGSGIGSFDAAYQMFENLDQVSPAWVNHAHNDYLEILLETGVFGAILMAAYAVVAGLALLIDLPRPLLRQRYAAVSIILILLAHSLTDYPLRTSGLLSIFAFANAMLFPARERRRVRQHGPYPANPPPGFATSHADAELGRA